MLGCAAASALVPGCGSSQEVRGVTAGQFISDEKLAAVEVCTTTGEQLLQTLGEPYSRGRDGTLLTFQWYAMVLAANNSQAGMASQSVFAWVDENGWVAGFVVNPASIPNTPAACPEQDPPAAPAKAPTTDI